jgi:hypothetical protein
MDSPTREGRAEKQINFALERWVSIAQAPSGRTFIKKKTDLPMQV